MADATITESHVFSLKQGMKKGAGMYVARLQIDDGETLTPGFKKILGVFLNTFANVAATWHVASAFAHATNTEDGAQITFSVGAVDDYVDDVGQNFYALIIGSNVAGTT